MQLNKPDRKITFIFRISEEEREAIRILAQRLNRSQGDAIRVTIMEKVESLNGKQDSPSG